MSDIEGERPVRPQRPAPGARPRKRPLSPRVRRNRTIAAGILLSLLLLLLVKCTPLADGDGDTPAPAPAGTTSSQAAPSSPADPSGEAAHEDNAEMHPSDLPTPTIGPSIPPRGDGRFTVVAVPGQVQPAASGREVTYSVEVEGGLGADPKEFAATVERVLLDPRGWQGVDGIRWVNVSAAEVAAGKHVDIRVTLESPETVDRMCAPMKTRSQVSCWAKGRANLNLRRYLLATDTYQGRLTDYRAYLVNHEVGHGLGHGHVNCPAPGKPSPVMLQQSYDIQGCTPWPWPKAP